MLHRTHQTPLFIMHLNTTAPRSATLDGRNACYRTSYNVTTQHNTSHKTPTLHMTHNTPPPHTTLQHNTIPKYSNTTLTEHALQYCNIRIQTTAPLKNHEYCDTSTYNTRTRTQLMTSFENVQRNTSTCKTKPKSSRKEDVEMEPSL